MTDDKLYKNRYVGIVLSGHNGYIGSTPEELETLRRRYLGKKSKRPLIAVRYFTEDEGQVQEASACTSANDALELLVRDGQTGIEIALEGGRGKKFDKRELTKDTVSQGDDPQINSKYAFGITNNFLLALAHGVYTNGRFFCPTGASVTSFGEVVSTAGPAYSGGVNPYEEFRQFADFYDFKLGPQTTELNEYERSRRNDDFFRLKDMAQADVLFGQSKSWLRFKEYIGTIGITTIDQLKTRIREFEENFFPGEFEKALDGIKQVRAWLRSLKE